MSRPPTFTAERAFAHFLLNIAPALGGVTAGGEHLPSQPLRTAETEEAFFAFLFSIGPGPVRARALTAEEDAWVGRALWLCLGVLHHLPNLASLYEAMLEDLPSSPSGTPATFSQYIERATAVRRSAKKSKASISARQAKLLAMGRRVEELSAAGVPLRDPSEAFLDGAYRQVAIEMLSSYGTVRRAHRMFLTRGLLFEPAEYGPVSAGQRRAGFPVVRPKGRPIKRQKMNTKN